MNQRVTIKIKTDVSQHATYIAHKLFFSFFFLKKKKKANTKQEVGSLIFSYVGEIKRIHSLRSFPAKG